MQQHTFTMCRLGLRSSRLSQRPAGPGQAKRLRQHCMGRLVASRASESGTIRWEVLTTEERSKLLNDSDNLFYSQPRFVTHVDGNFLSQLTELYRYSSARGWLLHRASADVPSLSNKN
jgi:hypothetical protein